MTNPISRRHLIAGAAGTAGLMIAGRHAVAQEATPAASPAAGDDARTISAVNGEITITGTPERVIVMEYELAEDLAVLGVDPVGVTERDSIPQWVPIPEYGPDVAEVGARDEPDIEAIIGLHPDLILAASPRQDEVLANLEAIAPFVQLSTYSPFATPTGLTPIESFQRVLTDVAIAVNREDVAEAAIADFTDLLTRGAEAIAASDYAGRSFIYGTLIDTAVVSVVNDHSRIGYTISQLGLTNLGKENEETPGRHYVETPFEQLGQFPEDALFFTSQSSATVEQYAPVLESDIWKAIPMVQAGNFINLGQPNIWSAGSAITLSDLIRRVVTALTGSDFS